MTSKKFSSDKNFFEKIRVVPKVDPKKFFSKIILARFLGLQNAKTHTEFRCLLNFCQKKFGAFSGCSKFQRVFKVFRVPKLIQKLNGQKKFGAFSGSSEFQNAYIISMPSKFWQKRFCAVSGCSAFRLFFRVDIRGCEVVTSWKIS